MRTPKNKKNVLPPAPWSMHEFFAGSGLVAYGLRGMFYPLWANDIDAKKAAVYGANWGEAHLVLDDIKNINGAALPFAHLSWASFPCQDLSLAGKLSGIEARRSGLIWEWLRILREMPQKPALLAIENVAGLLSADQGENYRKLHYALLALDYCSGAILLDAIHFVPQSRPRVFVLALRRGVDIARELQSSGPNWLHNKAAASLGAALPQWIWWYAPKPPPRRSSLAEMIDFSIPYDQDGVLQLLSPRHREKLRGMNDFVTTAYRRTRQGRQCLELRFDGAAGCLRTPQGGSSRQFLVVKQGGQTRARLLSAREAARLMGAPDSYILPPTYNDGYRAMGDAVAAPAVGFVGAALLMKLAAAAYGRG